MAGRKEVLVQELSELYRACHTGAHATITVHPVCGLAGYGNGTGCGKAPWRSNRSDWRRQLEGVGHLELPTTGRARRVRLIEEEHRVCTGSALTAALKAFAQKHAATLFMVLYACWAIFLSRVGATRDRHRYRPVATGGGRSMEGLNRILRSIPLSCGWKFEGILR